jgi:hypothetical protein
MLESLAGAMDGARHVSRGEEVERLREESFFVAGALRKGMTVYAA